MNYIQAVENAIHSAKNDINGKLPTYLSHGMGLSSSKNRIFLNQLISNLSPNVNYLEIGVWQGSTLFAALYGNEIKNAYAIDNFCEDFGHFKGSDIKEKFMSSLATFSLPVQFFDEDSFNLSFDTKNKIRDINVYFYDGGHEEIEQKKAITYYLDNMADTFVLIVDDWSQPQVKSGTKQGIEESKIKVVKSWELVSPDQNTSNTSEWWNGLFVAVCEK